MVTVSPRTRQLVPDKENLCVDLSALKLKCHCLRTITKNPATGSGHWTYPRHREEQTCCFSFKDPSKRILWDLGGGM